MKWCAVFAFVLAAVRVSAEPRPIHDAEREAVSLAAQALAAGPEALYARLAADSPLRALRKEDALRELEARTGPREGATWSLQTSEGERDAAFHIQWRSGYDDGLLFRMQRNGNGWTLREIVTLAEQPARTKSTEAPETTKKKTESRMPLIASCAMLLMLGAIFRERRLISLVLYAAGAACGVVAALPLLHRVREPSSNAPFVELRKLTAFRKELAEGREPKIPSDLSREARDVAVLWSLQSGMAVDVAGTKSDPIAELASATDTPLAEIVRARIALGQSHGDAAFAAFDRATSMAPIRDDILHEAAASFADDRAKAFVDRMRSIGSRDAETYYREAEESGSAQAFRTAWMLEPKPRAELVRDNLVQDLTAKSLISYFSAAEPVRRSNVLATRALSWPSGANAFVCGELLRVQIGTATMEIANGAALAPSNAQLIPATFGEQQRDADALRDAQELLEHAATPPRTRLIRAAIALSRHHRWDDVLKLTDEITPASTSVPTDLLVLRMRALLRAERLVEARTLAEGEGVKTIDDPLARIAIADAMGNAGQWETAESLFHLVRDDRYSELVTMRLRQLAMRRALATNSLTVVTAHFDIRHDSSINPAIASRIGDLLEAELTRLQRTLPQVELKRVAVNVLRWEDFSGGITNNDHILGLYDGEILFPFASVEQFKPEIVAVITHELTHAILAQATHDNAPRWFQEGVASRMELLPAQENIFRDTHPNIVLPVTLLDAVMEKNSDVSAYVVAQTFIHFLEDRFGTDVILKLSNDFARGTSTDEALIHLTGKSLDALNADFRTWGFQHTGDFTMSEPWPYSAWYSPGVDPRIREGFRMGAVSGDR